ncbi:hypothetical protein HPP92_015587 [Vanilla planifolia]|uniref:Uncharacterized protein n=1 Tax=Vanilla planifolia TaxID=51239 RepID=A0A835QNX0_VANPL|nr:hypothetical protein HPP92_015587 [Vanilla planifolia]
MYQHGKIHFDMSQQYLEKCGRRIMRITGFSKGKLPMKYPGVLIAKGRMKNEMLQPLVDKIFGRINGFIGKDLSKGGKLILIKDVLSSIPMHIMAIQDPTKETIRKINSSLANFFWSSRDNEKAHHWKAWKKITRPKEENGLGLRSLEHLSMAAACRMWWNYLYSDSLWVNMIKSMTHGRVNDNSSYCYGSTVWKRMMKLKKVLMDKMGSTTIQFEDLIGELSHQGKFNLSKAYEVGENQSI